MLKPDLRLHLFFTTENETAVILIRTARQLYRLVLWHRDTDTFQDGQWLKAEVYADSCSLTPDGRHFMFSVNTHWARGKYRDGYTVISHPPYFTALPVSNARYCWTSWGRFLGNALFEVGNRHHLNKPLWAGQEMQPVTRGEVTKDCRTGLRLLNGQPAPLTKAVRDTLLDGTAPPDTKPLDRYDTMNGCLHRRNADGSLTLIRDFHGMEFEPIVAPYDVRPAASADETAWHPLDGDLK
ncbi:hypothetical protein BDE40_2844 [Litoreibacter halocynthiae]|uniref:Uncharacterized protein n=1 Tax=Litoreibacter halocynthiae TaxID=1242689 RepID=A0A4R7LFV1_9RHOB|nr:hypothetical protein [Litoreibacter halocynthiae]TDT74059.1 hypothetical protein BDE40_2844 [Litoreibacter halocynthiae]